MRRKFKTWKTRENLVRWGTVISQWKRWVAIDIRLDCFHTKYLSSIAYPNNWMTSVHSGFFENIRSASTKEYIFVVASMYKGSST
jgi:hypothetical protein